MPSCFQSLIYLGVCIPLMGFVVLFFFLWQSSLVFWREAGVAALWASEWYPYENLYGLLPALAGTVWALLIAMLIVIPCALAAAIVSSEILPDSMRALFRLLMGGLAGIPSVVYGLLGLWVLLPFLQTSLGLLSGHSLLVAGLMLSLMMLPTVVVMAEDALHGVPQEQREAAMLLGLGWEARLWRVILPQAAVGIRSGVLLALGRGLGETMAVMLVVGSMDRLPEPFYDILEPAQTLTSRIGREIGEAAFGSVHFSALMACGLVLTIVILPLLTVNMIHALERIAEEQSEAARSLGLSPVKLVWRVWLPQA